MIDKSFITEKMSKKLYNPCIGGKTNEIWKSYQIGFPNNSLCDVIRLGIPFAKKMEFLL